MISNSSIKTIVSRTSAELGQKAGASAAEKIKQAISARGQANIIMATGTAQYETLRYLINDKSIDWSSVVMFHLDEYIGIPGTHKASFRKFLTERFLDKVPPLKKTHLINGYDDVNQEIEYLNEAIRKHPIDVALIGIGENGHVAFNDPPADFDTEIPFIVVKLDETCRRQQVSEQWFEAIDKVPTNAVSMSVKQMMKATSIIASVPDKRKAPAVFNTLNQDIDPRYPSSILRTHPDCELYIDTESASLLTGIPIVTMNTVY